MSPEALDNTRCASSNHTKTRIKRDRWETKDVGQFGCVVIEGDQGRQGQKERDLARILFPKRAVRGGPS